MIRRPSLHPVGLLLVALLTFPSPAAAQATSRVQAESLFETGLAEMRAGNFARACPALEQSQRLDPGVGTLLYLGECYELSGATASAWATFREAASLAAASGQAERAATGAERAARLEPRLARVRIVIDPRSAALANLSVHRDDAEVTRAMWGEALPVDPGPHQIVVAAPGYRTVTLDVDVADGAPTMEISVPPLEPAPAPAAPTTAAPTAAPVTPGPVVPGPPAIEPQRGRAQRRAAFGLSLVGAAGVGAGAALGLHAIRRNDAALDHCQGDLCRDERGVTLSRQALDSAHAADVAFLVGGAAAAGAVVLWLTAPSRTERPIAVVPAVSGSLVGLRIEGSLR